MPFQVRIQNLGKLADAKVCVGDLTVLAGANNTGKSFFSKFAYSMLDAMGRENLATQGVQKFTDSILSRFPSLKVREMVGEEKVLDLVALVQKLEEESESIAPDDGSLKRFHPEFVRLVEKAMAEYRAIAPDIERASGNNGGARNRGEPRHERLKRDFDGLASLSGQSGLDITLGSINNAFVNALIENFQVANLSALQSGDERGITVEVSGYGSAVVSDFAVSDVFHGRGEEETAISEAPAEVPSFDPNLLQLVTGFGLVYLESPTLWKLQVALEDVRRSSRTRGRVNGVPRYFYDLADTLRGEFTGKVAFPDVLEHLTGERGIGGKIVRDDFGNMLFHEKKADRMFPLAATAMGVANLGILALLIERKILTPGTFLVIDEPESNLHPEWQMVMTEALWELARGGVKVLIATHSVDILKRLEIYAEEKDTEEAAANLIEVNHFRRDGTVQNGGVEKIVDVQEDLSAPFFELYKRGL